MRKGCVVLHCGRGDEFLRTHEGIALAAVGQRLARLKAYDFLGPYDASARYDGHRFFVPDDTLIVEDAEALGIRSANDLFGGVVPYGFVKTKVISHELVDADAAHPEGWSDAFAARTRSLVLPGYTVFSRRDARRAGARLLGGGAVRAKQPLSAGSRGQSVLATIADLDGLLDTLRDDDLAATGLVLERNLRTIETLSIGQVSLGDLIVTYHGTQRVTPDNAGRAVYGGSDLVCVRGGWEALDSLDLADNTRRAVAQARRYDEATVEYRGLLASRRNYDVGQGIADDGRWYSGVLEQSWRVGGATGAEVAALEAFVQDDSLDRVETSSVELYGPAARPPPPGSVVYFDGVDMTFGPMLRYAVVSARGRRPAAS